MPTDFIMTRRVQFAETDMAGILHFSNYFRYMEEIEHAFWRSLRESVYTERRSRIVSWPRVSVTCEYFAPARFEDELELAMRITCVGDRSLTFDVEFRLDKQRIALGRITAVCCETCNGAFAPIPIPDEIREKVAPQCAARQ